MEAMMLFQIVLTGSPAASGSSFTSHGQMALRSSATPNSTRVL